MPRPSGCPFADASIDTVICTLVLCTVQDPAAALSEIVRVLRPGGQLLFIEHVRSQSRALAWCQDRLAGAWRRYAEGCHCNRPTAALMASAVSRSTPATERGGRCCRSCGR